MLKIKGNTVSAKTLNSTTVFNIENIAANQHIKTISERSCNTEDWRNGFLKFSFATTKIWYGLNMVKSYYYDTAQWNTGFWNINLCDFYVFHFTVWFSLNKMI